jgi:hypothetical protein
MITDIESKRSWARIKKQRGNHGRLRDLPNEKTVFSAVSVIGGIVLALILILCAAAVQASEIPQETAVRILIGEAANQGEHGMICVAEVLRQRGSIKGFYGLKAKHVDNQPAWVWEQARRAWRASATTNYTAGATHFENIKSFGVPSWARTMRIVYHYKDHTFYKNAGINPRAGGVRQSAEPLLPHLLYMVKK